MTYDITSRLEDAIISGINNSSLLKREIDRIFKDLNILDTYEAPFGDERLLTVLEDYRKGGILDSSYIQNLDFNHVLGTKSTQSFMDGIGSPKLGSKNFAEVDPQYGDKESHDPAHEALDRLKGHGIDFKSLVLDPVFITDWPQYKFEMIGHFDLPTSTVEDAIQNNRIDELCDRTTVSLLANLHEVLPSVPPLADIEELRTYFVEHPSDFLQAVKDVNSLQGPSLDQYINIVSDTTDRIDLLNGLRDSDYPNTFIRAKTELNDELRNRTFHAFSENPRINKESLNGLLFKSERRSRKYNVYPEDLSASEVELGLTDAILPQHRPYAEALERSGVPRIDKITPCKGYKEYFVLMYGQPEDVKIKILGDARGKVVPRDFMKLCEYAFSESVKIPKISIASGDQKISVKSNDTDEIPTGDDLTHPNPNFNHRPEPKMIRVSEEN